MTDQVYPDAARPPMGSLDEVRQHASGKCLGPATEWVRTFLRLHCTCETRGFGGVPLERSTVISQSSRRRRLPAAAAASSSVLQPGHLPTIS